MAMRWARSGQPAEAVAAAARAVDHLRSVALPLCGTAARAISLLESSSAGNPLLMKQSLEALLRGPLAIALADGPRLDTAQRLAFALGDPSLCLQALGSEVDHPRWKWTTLVGRMTCLRDAGDRRANAAEQDVQKYLLATPGRLADGLGTSLEESAPRAAASGL